MQTEDFVGRERLFSPDYAYFSSYSTSWVAHAKTYVTEMTDRLGLGSDDVVVEVASNDGYLLQHVKERGIGCLGIEPTASTAAAARDRGIETVERFFGSELADELRTAGVAPRLMIANNVLAHVPDINDFLQGFAHLLAPSGVATFEFPHLAVLLRDGLFDTIYHEHFSYLSLGAVQRIFQRNGLEVFDVEEIPTHGGSLRVYAHRLDAQAFSVENRVHRLIQSERDAGLFTADGYAGLQLKADATRAWLRAFVKRQQALGHVIMGYGAAAKGSILLNYADVGSDHITAIADRSPWKQGRQLPGTGIPIVHEDDLRENKPDVVLVLPWNLRSEVEQQLSYIRDWGGRFAVALPVGQTW